MRSFLLTTSLIAATLAFGLSGRADATAGEHLTPLQINQRTAAHLATARLRSVSLPPGSQPTDGPPHGSRHLLDRPPYTLGTPAAIYRHEWWQVPRAPVGVFHWVARHRPRGSIEGDEGSVGRSGADDVHWRDWEWAGGERVLGSSVTVSVVPERGGGSADRLDAISIWREPRPRAERIPPGVKAIELRIEHLPDEGVAVEEGHPPVVPPNEGVTRSLRIERRSRVRQVVGLVEGLHVTQPGEILCPPEEFREPGSPLPSTVRLLFENRRGGVLAEATQSEGPGICNPLRFSVRGKRMWPLEEGQLFLRALIPERRQARLVPTRTSP